MKSPLSGARLALLLSLAWPGLSLAQKLVLEPPSPTYAFPGKWAGTASERWIAPFVYYSDRWVGGKREYAITWYDEHGAVTKTVSGPNVSLPAGFISEQAKDGYAIHGLDGSWRGVLSEKTGPLTMFDSWEGSGDTFLRLHYPTQDPECLVDVYYRGRFLGSAGPFLQGPNPRIQLVEDGYAALIAWKDNRKTAAQVVVIGPDGKIAFREECDKGAFDPYPIMHGKGVLLTVPRADSDESNQKQFVDADGTHVLFDAKTNGTLLATDPASDLLLFVQGRPDDTEFLQLVHATTGALVWQIDSPVRVYVHQNQVESTHAVFAGDKLLLLNMDAAAVDPRSGEVLGVWKAQQRTPAVGAFYRRGDDIYIVGDNQFFKLDLDDIAAKRNGWK